MTRIILSGAKGTMGGVISRYVQRQDGCEIVAGIDPFDGPDWGYPVFKTPGECDTPADVIIDFSNTAATDGILAFALARRLPIVVATTGLSEKQVEAIGEASKVIPVFYTANMSLGVNLMKEIAMFSARILGDIFDIEVVEWHHNKKEDAPSGTALMLANAISSELAVKPHYVYDRHAQRKKRDKHEIGLHAIRGGTIVGEHNIVFAGQDELLTISHRSGSKEIYATGAVSAALYICQQPPGLYDMTRLMQKHGVARMDLQDGVNLVTFGSVPDGRLMEEIFERFAAAGITIDMISQAGVLGKNAAISFTCGQNDTDSASRVAAAIQKEHPGVEVGLDSGNCKLVLSGSEMKTSHGVFSRALKALASTDAVVKLVTTAETEFSFLLADGHREQAAAALSEAFQLGAYRE